MRGKIVCADEGRRADFHEAVVSALNKGKYFVSDPTFYQVFLKKVYGDKGLLIPPGDDPDDCDILSSSLPLAVLPDMGEYEPLWGNIPGAGDHHDILAARVKAALDDRGIPYIEEEAPAGQ